jgi:glutamate formiminotransferase / formiminotetrahydrofolate cyclodeaminase
MTDASGSNRPLVLIVPNFSEGRRREVIDAIVEALQVPGALLLNTQWDPDHNRLDCTLAADPATAKASALAGARKAVELIDMEQHEGSHPRMGAVDVIPFVPVRGLSMEECVEMAREFGRELAESLDVPVYLYDQAALEPGRTSLAEVRKGQYEGLRADVAEGRRLPDFGPNALGKAGAVAVGARRPLVAFNVYFAGDDEGAVKRVAKAVRESSGGLRNVRAVGFAVPERGMVTVSMNLVDVEATPIHRALELVKVEAARHGLAVKETEIVGLVPERALADAVEHYVQLAGFDHEGQVLEALIARADAEARSGGAEARDGVGAEASGSLGIGGQTIGGFLGRLSSSDPTPGGGSAAAVAGAAGAALVAMVARLTIGRKGYEGLDDRMAQMVPQAESARDELMALADEDAEAFDDVMASFKLPKGSDEERAARTAAIQAAMMGAANVPLAVTRLAVDTLELAREVTETGNVNAVSDGAAAAQLLAASTWAALANVEINLASIKDEEYVETTRFEVDRLRARAGEARGAAEAAFTARLAD